MTAEVRPVLLPGDGDALLRLIFAHAVYERNGQVFDGLLGRLRTRIAERRLRIWVAVEDDTICGYASMTVDVATWTGYNFAHLDCLFVDEDSRSRGIGASLLAAVVVKAHGLGCTELQWQTPDWNERAIAFYRRTGAVDRAKARFTLSFL